jgi:hypothetical protein
MTHGGHRVKGGLPIEATQDGRTITKTARELADMYYCDIRTIYYHVENGRPFEGVTFRWAN